MLSFGIGFLGILFDERRRAWEDRLAGADVVYEEDRPEPAPWSTLSPPERESEAEPAPVAAGD